MKLIYYRKSNSLYQKGIFISIKGAATVLMVIAVILFYSMGFIADYPIIAEMPIWYLFPILILLGLLVPYFMELQEKSEVHLDSSHYNGINTYGYIRNKIKKKKGKSIGQYGYVRIIGDYEFDSAIYKYNELLSFYEECLIKLKEIQKDKIEETNFRKSNYLLRELEYKIEILKSISKIETISHY